MLQVAFIFLFTEKSFAYYAVFLVLMGLTATWCCVGVNWPILSEIVDPQSRSGIMAWESAMEGAISSFLGNAAVGFLAQNLFGFNLADESEAEKNAHALGKALTLTSVFPWLLCLFCYIFLHWAFPYDRRKIQEEKEEFLKDHGGKLYEDSSSESDNEEDYLTYLG